ncbi:MbtH family protein [Actinoplanes utahensis]|uniref:Protein mbtH n=1 Tax=Actinoplanes utahensis TaxID=1869 RepID=A0A0A6UL78_ACTUT|nr:MbtH family NRPS accessory protein [Actinoplanes utahensis]KHD75793.1 protein mbtH [Actinoplanes utahensis]GIF32182.1 protein mbtH [Actinoplanes utahensis]
MPNPFDIPDGRFLVLVNEEGQHSLWPEAVPAPAGWAITHGAADRETCLAHVRANWTDLRPRSLRVHPGEV